MMSRQSQTHPKLRYRAREHCPRCGSGWVRTFPDGKRRCGACGKGLIRKSCRERRERHRPGGGTCAAALRPPSAHCRLRCGADARAT